MKDVMDLDIEGISAHAPAVEDLGQWSVDQLARELDRIRTRLTGREEALRLEMDWIEEDKQAIARIEAELAIRERKEQH